MIPFHLKMDVHIAFFILGEKRNITIDTQTLCMNEADVTSTYFVLIGYSHRELGRVVLNTFTSDKVNRTQF